MKLYLALLSACATAAFAESTSHQGLTLIRIPGEDCQLTKEDLDPYAYGKYQIFWNGVQNWTIDENRPHNIYIQIDLKNATDDSQLPPKETVIPVDYFVKESRNCMIEFEINANRTLLLYYKTPDGYETYESYDGKPQNVKVAFGTDPIVYDLDSTPHRTEAVYNCTMPAI